MGGSSSRGMMAVLQKSSEGGENDRIKYGASSMQGWRRYMEDARAVVPDLDENTSFFGVYGAHGGAEVALLCATIFHTELRKDQNYQNDCRSAMESTFFRMDEVLLQSDDWKELIKRRGDWVQYLKTSVCAHCWPFTQAQTIPYVAPQRTGSTACIVVVRGNRIIIGNVGNSRCVLSSNGQAIQLTRDHKPNEEDEKERILKAGGRIIRDTRSGTYRINEELSVSRVIGYFAFKQNEDLPPEEQVVICDPQLICMNMTNNTEFLIIASGIWDCITSDGAVALVHSYFKRGVNDLPFICERLADRAMQSDDSPTAIIVMFKHAARSRRQGRGRGRQVEAAAAAAGGSRNEVNMPTVVEIEEEEDDHPTPPHVAEKEQHNEASSSERRPLLYINNDVTEEY